MKEKVFDSVRKNVSETNDPIEIKWKPKRGTGTRDEDRLPVKVKGEDPEKVLDKFEALVDGIRERGLFEKVRGFKPDEEVEEAGN